MPMTLAMPRLGWLSQFLIDAAGPGSWPGGKGDRAACHRAQCPGYRELGYGHGDTAPATCERKTHVRACYTSSGSRYCHSAALIPRRLHPADAIRGHRRPHAPIHYGRPMALGYGTTAQAVAPNSVRRRLTPKLRLVRQVIQGLTWGSVGLARRCSGY